MYSLESLAEHLSILLIGAALLILLLPACLFMVAFFSDSARRFLAQWPSWSQRFRYAFQHRRQVESRQGVRITTRELRAEITDGRSSYRGLVNNISLCGICISDLPENVCSSRRLISIVIHGTTGHHRLVARPRWEILQANHAKTIGAELANPPEKWSQFVLSQ